MLLNPKWDSEIFYSKIKKIKKKLIPFENQTHTLDLLEYLFTLG